MEFLFTGNQPDSVYNNVFYAQERSLGWKQDSTKVVFSDWMGKAGMYKRARRKVNNNKGEGRELSTIGSSKFNIKNIF